MQNIFKNHQKNNHSRTSILINKTCTHNRYRGRDDRFEQLIRILSKRAVVKKEDKTNT